MLRATTLAIWAMLLGLLAPISAEAQLTTPKKISATEGETRGSIERNFDLQLGDTVVNAGDVDGDGIDDLALVADVSLWILFMNGDGTVRTYQEAGGDWESEPLGTVAPLGDFDGDGVPDLLVTVYVGDINGDNPYGFSTRIWYLNRDGTVGRKKTVCDTPTCGAMVGDRPVDIDGDGVNDYLESGSGGATIHLLKADGEVRHSQRICNYGPPLNPFPPCQSGNFFGDGPFGGATSNLGDLDGDGVPELAVGGSLRGIPSNWCGPIPIPVCLNGAVWILFMNQNGTVKDYKKITPADGGFSDALGESAFFGGAITTLGDLDGDGVPELAVGAPYSVELNEAPGEVWVLFLNRDGTVKDQRKITQGDGGFTGMLHRQDHFGWDLTRLGDIDDDPETVETLVVMSVADVVQGVNRGALWFLFLRADGTVKRHHKMRSVDFLFYLLDYDHFGQAVTPLGDLDGDGVPEVAIGAPDYDRDDRGAVWVLFPHRNGTIKRHQKISASWGGFTGTLDEGDRFGASLVRLDEPGPDGVTLAVGAPGDDDGGADHGAVWVLSLNRDGTVTDHHKISSASWNGALHDEDAFGTALAAPGDLDGDGLDDLAVGAPFDDEMGLDRGAVYTLRLNRDGSVRAHEKITDAETIHLGRSLAGLGPRGSAHGLAVGAIGDPGLWVLALDANGKTTSQRPLTRADVGVDAFAGSLAGLGDLDGDGLEELALGTITDGAEAMTLLFLDAEGRVTTTQTLESFSASARTGFGQGLAPLGDLDGDGVPDLAIGAPFDGDGGPERGALWLTSLRELLGVAIEAPVAEPEVPTLGQDVALTARMVDLSGQGRIQASVFFRRGGEPSFFSTPLVEQTPGEFHATIPALANGERGVEYFIEAANGLGITTRLPASGAVSVPVHVPQGLRHGLHAGNEASAYRLLSIPLDLDEKSARTLLEDDLGPYDKKKWRLFNEFQFVELDKFDLALHPGEAYWLIVKDAGRELTTGSGTSLRTDGPFAVTLHPGWSFVSSPFSFAVPVANTRTDDGQAVEFLHYAGDWAPVESALEPFEGYAVFSAQADTLLIFPDGALQAVSAASRPAKRSEALDWSIRIRAYHGEARDTHTYAAVAEGASSGWDALDREEPPAVGDYVRVSFPHGEWERRAEHYSVDVRPAPEREERWEFAVETRRSGRVELRFEGVASVPEEYGVWLIDEAVGVRQDLRLEPGYAVVTGGSGEARRLTLVVSLDAMRAQEVPSRFELLGNFPNPFRGATTIRYGMPESAEVRLEVFDVLGRRVSVLVSGEVSAGYHGVVWDGRSESGVPVGSGLYVVRLRTGRFEQTRPMVLVK